MIYYQTNRKGDTAIHCLATANFTEFLMRLYRSRYYWIMIHELSIDDGALKKRVPNQDAHMSLDIRKLQSNSIDCDFKP